MMRLLVCGSRWWIDKEFIRRVLKGYETEYGPLLIIEGGAKGADTIAREIATEEAWVVLEYQAQWNKYGRAAGPIRNQQMIDEGQPEEVVAFHMEGSRGTQDMIDRARKAGLLVAVYKKERVNEENCV